MGSLYCLSNSNDSCFNSLIAIGWFVVLYIYTFQFVPECSARFGRTKRILDLAYHADKNFYSPLSHVCILQWYAKKSKKILDSWPRALPSMPIFAILPHQKAPYLAVSWQRHTQTRRGSQLAYGCLGLSHLTAIHRTKGEVVYWINSLY